MAPRAARRASPGRHDRTEGTKEITMYGTIAHLQPKPGKEGEVIRAFEEWHRERRPKVAGAIGGQLYRLDRGGMMATAVFASRETYLANASDPAQDQWYRGLRELLATDPEWHDGEIVTSA